jgi:hypothetical protein
MRPIKYIIICLISCLISSTLIAQEDGAELLKPFKAKLAESVKKKSMPILPTLDTVGDKSVYEVPEHVIGLKYPDPTLRPLAMPNEAADPANTFYAKAGFGYPISPNLELSYNTKQNKNLKFGVDFDHLSSQGNISNQYFSKTHFDLGATYFTPKGIAAGAKLGFNLDANRFYGHNELSRILPDSLDIFPDTLLVNKDSVSQRFFEFFGNLHLFNAKVSKLQLNYNVDADFHVMNDKYGASEFVFAPKANVEKWLGSGKQKHRIFADLYLNLANFNKDSIKSRTLFNFHPGVDLNFGAFKATVAMNLGSSEKKAFILPDLKMKLSLSEGKFNVYAGWKGEMRLNTFRSLSNYNPFIASNLELRHTKFNDIFGGLSGNIKGIGYDFRASYAMATNMPLFLNDSTTNYLRFKVLYDSLNIVSLKGTLDFKMIKNLTVLASLGYNIYSGGSFSKAYHLPVFESNFTVMYRVKQLLLKSEIYFNSGVPYYDLVSNSDETLNSLFDINLSASYWFGEQKQNVGVFAEVNNILNNKNQRWYLYPQIGFNARAGFLVKF